MAAQYRKSFLLPWQPTVVQVASQAETLANAALDSAKVAVQTVGDAEARFSTLGDVYEASQQARSAVTVANQTAVDVQNRAQAQTAVLGVVLLLAVAFFVWRG